MASVGGEAGRTEDDPDKEDNEENGGESGEDGAEGARHEERDREVPTGAEGGAQEPPAVEGEKLAEGEGERDGRDTTGAKEGGVQDPPAVGGEKLAKGEGERDGGDAAGAKESGAWDPLAVEGQKLGEGEGKRDGGDAAGAKEGGVQDPFTAKEHILQNLVEQERKRGGEKEAENAGEEGPTTWPKWMANGHTLLKACPVGGRDKSWATVVKTWVLLEEAYDFETSVSSNSICRGKTVTYLTSRQPRYRPNQA
jgi:hypothetical protein